ncbi:hypothetical protein ACVIGB_000528 [Bradyrhizobium sp. USDA 4341]
MSRKHPQDGPSLSKAPHKKRKPLTDKELAAKHEKERQADEARNARVQAAKKKVAAGRRFSEAITANGGTIPLRGGNAPEFWSKLK